MSDKVPLTVGIEADQLVVRIGIKTLADCADLSPMFYDPESDEQSMKVTDPHLFAKAVVDELLDEKEDGTTPVHEMFDAAFQSACENGCEGVACAEDDDEH